MGLGRSDELGSIEPGKLADPMTSDTTTTKRLTVVTRPTCPRTRRVVGRDAEPSPCLLAVTVAVAVGGVSTRGRRVRRGWGVYRGGGRLTDQDVRLTPSTSTH